MTQISIIIPIFNEVQNLAKLKSQLKPYLNQPELEIIIVDGGSSDGSLQCYLKNEFAAGLIVIHSEKGRAVQMNAGAQIAKGHLLLFLHADTQLPNHAQLDLLTLTTQLDKGHKIWGRFNVCIAGRPWMLRVIAFSINWRSKISGIATGDQAIFVKRSQFIEVNGFVEQALMEDIDLSARLLKFSRPLCMKEQVTTSGRRWEKFGIFTTLLLMWKLRFDYWRGVPADELAKRYR